MIDLKKMKIPSCYSSANNTCLFYLVPRKLKAFSPLWSKSIFNSHGWVWVRLLDSLEADIHLYCPIVFKRPVPTKLLAADSVEGHVNLVYDQHLALIELIWIRELLYLTKST